MNGMVTDGYLLNRSDSVDENGDDNNDITTLNTAYIPAKTQHMMWFSGLRGAVAFALASNFPDKYGNRDQILLTTMMVVLISVFGLGTLTSAVLNCLKIETDIDETKYDIEISELKIRTLATVDIVLAKLCLEQQHWEFEPRDTLVGYSGSLTDLVGGTSSYRRSGSAGRSFDRNLSGLAIGNSSRAQGGGSKGDMTEKLLNPVREEDIEAAVRLDSTETMLTAQERLALQHQQYLDANRAASNDGRQVSKSSTTRLNSNSTSYISSTATSTDEQDVGEMTVEQQDAARKKAVRVGLGLGA